MSAESELAGPLSVWIARLQQKVNALEEASRETEDRQMLLKEIATCDTYWKKIYVRAKDFVFSTPQGPQMARDLARIQEQLTLIRNNVRKNSTWAPFTLKREAWEPFMGE